MAPKKKPYKSLSKSAKFYRDNLSARRKKSKVDKEINSRPEQKKKRRESGRARTKAKSQGKNIRGKDYDHAVKRFVKSSKNRGRRAEGGRKKR